MRNAIFAATIFAIASFFLSISAQAQYSADCVYVQRPSGLECINKISNVPQTRFFGVYTKAPKSVAEAATVKQPRIVGKPKGLPKVAKVIEKKTITSYAVHQSKQTTGRLSLDGFPAPLVAKVRELEQACGAKLISAFRPNARVRGSGQLSLHASKRAVDMSGNARCIYAHMQGWPGGYSTDYAAVAHIHISYAPGSGEWGARFAHWKPRRTGVGG